MISVVIPTLNEAATIGGLLAQLAAEGEAHEVIVVDGGSRDETASMARRAGVTVVASPPGRGTQLRAGTDRARGESLLFLHADSRIGQGALAAVARRLVEHPDIVGGNFRLIFDGDDPFSHWLNGFYRWLRSKGFYYGDSGIFVRRQAYERLGGIRPIALMEDYDLVRKLERLGATCCIADPPIVTSSRRFHGRRPTAIVLNWLMIHALFHLNITPESLARFYDRTSHRPGVVAWRPHVGDAAPTPRPPGQVKT